MRTKSKSIYSASVLGAALALGFANQTVIGVPFEPVISTVNAIQNFSFESGNLTSWSTSPALGYGDFRVRATGYNSQFGFFDTTPTDGGFAATTPFDGVPRTIRLFQDVSVPCGAATFSFDYRCAWNLDHTEWPNSTLPRTFYVAFEPAGGGAILQSNLVLEIQPNTQQFDGGPQTVTIDATAYQGSSVRVSFNFVVPESNTGPAFAQIDNVQLSTEINVAPTDLSLSKSSIRENQPIGTPVGTLTGVDANSNEAFAFALTSGNGDTDNASFTIDGDQLKTTAIFDYETKTSYNIRVTASDRCGESVDKELTISVSNLTAVPGIYTGLFSAGSGVDFKSAGYIQMKVGKTFGVSGKLLVDGNAVAFTGKMNGDGAVTTVTKRRFISTDKPELTLTLALDEPATTRLGGTIQQVAGSAWTSDVLGHRTIWTPAAQATQFVSKYTMAVPNSGDGPAGSGYELINVNTVGRTLFKGKMADGHTAPQTTFVSKDGYLPFFSPMYKQKGVTINGYPLNYFRGFAMGWLQLTNNNGEGNLAPVGEVHWVKTGWTDNVYTTGFTNVNEVLGSRWSVTPGVRAVEMSKASVSFSLGNLTAPFSGKYSIIGFAGLAPIKPVLVGDYPNGLKAAAAGASYDHHGLTYGTFLHPVSGIRVRWYAVMLQDLNLGEGFFMGPSVGGKVELVSADDIIRD